MDHYDEGICHVDLSLHQTDALLSVHHSLPSPLLLAEQAGHRWVHAQPESVRARHGQHAWRDTEQRPHDAVAAVGGDASGEDRERYREA